jgi:nitronate monooxygenase
MLGADGVVIGSRFWASREALVHQKMWDAAIAATGDDTIRSSVMDIARGLAWPERFTARVLKNDFTDKWHDDIDGLKAVAGREAKEWLAAWRSGDTRTANTFVGEVTGLFDSTKPAADIVSDIMKEAETLLSKNFASD